MKKIYFTLALLLGSIASFAQTERGLEDINEKNSWLKAGLLIGAPAGPVADYKSFIVGLDLAAQLMRTDNFGLGIATGYSKYFKKSDAPSDIQGISDGFSAFPVGGMFRYYPQSEGLFVGTDLGYTFLTGVESENKGGAYVRPQIGYHNYSWNVFAYYNHILRPETTIDIQSIGLAMTYNIRFK